MSGRRQVACLRKEFRRGSGEERFGNGGDKVILEPMNEPPFDVGAWLAQLEQYRDIPFPELPDDPVLAPSDPITFD